VKEGDDTFVDTSDMQVQMKAHAFEAGSESKKSEVCVLYACKKTKEKHSTQKMNKIFGHRKQR
jgi:hypothetical protein